MWEGYVGYLEKKKKIGRRWDREVCLAGMPKLPRVAGFGGFDPPPECLAAWIAGPLQGQKHVRAAKCGSRPRDGRTVRDALRVRTTAPAIFKNSFSQFFFCTFSIFLSEGVFLFFFWK